jgi:hypothetical protein
MRPCLSAATFKVRHLLRCAACQTGAIDKVEGQREALPHLVAPLQAERRRREDEDALNPAAQQQLRQDETRLHGLAKPHIVCNQ